MKNSTKLKFGLFAGLAALTGAAVAAAMMQRRREEQVYHEAELKAMGELERMMEDDTCPPACSCGCSCDAEEDALYGKDEWFEPDIDVEITAADEDDIIHF